MASDEEEAAAVAADRLRVLEKHHLAPGRSGAPSGRAARAATGVAPLNVGILSHMTASVQEIREHARADADTACDLYPDTEVRARPAEDSQLYAWWRSIPVPPDRSAYRDAVIHRQALEHAVKAGDFTPVRRERCPKCRCLGMFWQAPLQIAVCANSRCVDDDGLSRRWTLAQLAHHHVVEQRMLEDRATS